MGILDPYSKRQKRLRGEVPDVYRYDDLPRRLRVQIIRIWMRVFGVPSHELFMPDDREEIYKDIVDALCHERGVFRLEYAGMDGVVGVHNHLANYFLQESDVELALDVVELCASKIDEVSEQQPWRPRESDQAIAEINIRFKEHGVGYSYENGRIIRKDGDFVHAEIVKPCLRVLAGREYRGAQEEFLRGHDHYRNGNMKEAMNEALKAFESVMKVICRKRRWRITEGAGASKLISVCLEKELVPPLWQQQFTSLKSLLEGGVAPARNRLSGHGQGAVPIVVPRHVAAFALHMTAAAILFLAEAEASGAGK